MLLVKILAVILLIIVFILAIIILIPYSYILDGNSDERRIGFSILWLFGLVKIQFSKYFGQENELELTVFNFTKRLDNKPSNSTKVTKKSKQKNKKKDKGKKSNNIKWKKHINKAVIDETIILIKKIWRRLKPLTIDIDAKAGFDDPMYTGLLYGLYCQFSYLIKKDSIRLEPIFNEKTLEGNFYVRGNIWIIYLLMVFLSFLLSSPIRKEIKLIRKEKGGAQHVR